MTTAAEWSLNDLTLESIEKYFPAVNLLYNSMRLVDPVSKTVMTWDGHILNNTAETCYDYWCRGKSCENCISARANNEKKCIIKLESGSKCIMMVTALPVNYHGGPLALELLKDVTDSLVFGPRTQMDVEHVYKAIAELSTMAVTDHLTSLYNRRFVDDRLEFDIQKARDSQKPLSVFFIDIDDFKKINDEYGHEYGDKVLKTAVGIIKKCIRSSDDWAARYGGDEFLVCLNDTDSDTARAVARRILDNIQKTTINVKDKTIQLQLSIGIHTMHQQPLTTAELIQIADIRMYEAKSSGKNRISQSIDKSVIPPDQEPNA